MWWIVCELRCDVKCGVMSVYVKCGAMWTVAFVIEMQNVRCGIWPGVECGVLVCGMLLNEKCGKLRRYVKCGRVELRW